MYSSPYAPSASSKRPSTSNSSLAPSTFRSSAPDSYWSNSGSPEIPRDYSELINRQHEAETSRREEMLSKSQAVQRTQEEESYALEQSHKHQMEVFVANSDALLTEARNRCMSAENALIAKHNDERNVWGKASSLDNMRPKATKDLIELRNKEGKCLKMSDWKSADQFRAIAQELEVHEMHAQAGSWNTKWELEEAKMNQRHARELKALRLKNSRTTTEAILKQERELEKMQHHHHDCNLQKRLSGAALALSKQHTKERQMLEQSFKGQYPIQRNPPASALYTAGAYIKPSPGSAYSSTWGSRRTSAVQRNVQDENRQDHCRRPMTTESVRGAKQYNVQEQYNGYKGQPPARYGAKSSVRQSDDLFRAQHHAPAWSGSGQAQDGTSVYLTDDLADALPGGGPRPPPPMQDPPRLNLPGPDSPRLHGGPDTSSPRWANGHPDGGREERSSSGVFNGGPSRHGLSDRNPDTSSRRPRVTSGGSLRSSTRSSDGGFIGPHAVTRNAAQMPKGIYERMQVKKASEALSEHARRLGLSNQGATGLTEKNLARLQSSAPIIPNHAHEYGNNGHHMSNQAPPPLATAPEVVPEYAGIPHHHVPPSDMYRQHHVPPSDLFSNEACAGSVRPATAAPRVS